MHPVTTSLFSALLLIPGASLAQGTASALSPYAVPATFSVSPPVPCTAPVASVVAVPASHPCSLTAPGTLPAGPAPLVRLDPVRRPFDPAALQGLLRMGLCAATRGSC